MGAIGFVYTAVLMAPLILTPLAPFVILVMLGIFIAGAVKLDKSMLTIREEQEMLARAHYHVCYIFLERYRHTEYWECHCGHVFSIYVD